MDGRTVMDRVEASNTQKTIDPNRRLSEIHIFQAKDNMPAWQSFPVDLLAGSTLGGLAHTVVAPIERVKLVLQTQHSNGTLMGGKGEKYRGMVDAMVRITREEGFLSLWRGNGSSVLRYYPSVALNFAFKDYYRALLVGPLPSSSSLRDLPSAERWRISAGNFSAGALAGATSLLFTYPLDIAHTRLATDVGRARKFAGLRNFITATHRRDGIRGLYQGFPASVHGILVHRGVYFGGFDTLKQLLLPTSEESGKVGVGGSFWGRWCLAQVATTSAGLISYPFDTVRHRMMMQAGEGHKMYSHTMDCWRKVYGGEGIAGFYKGCVSNMFRGTGAAFILVMYDEVKAFMHRRVI